jgi:hypothetical protein
MNSDFGEEVKFLNLIVTTLFFGAVFFSCSSSPYSRFPASNSEIILPSGAKYKLISNTSIHLGNSYQDPHGLVWGELIKDKNGKPKQLSYYEAESLCHSIIVGSESARLPTSIELHRMRDDHSLSPNTFFPETGEENYNSTYKGTDSAEYLPGIDVPYLISSAEYWKPNDFRHGVVWKLWAPSTGSSVGGNLQIASLGENFYARCVYGVKALMATHANDGNSYPQEYVTSQNVKFKRVLDVPKEMGASYADPMGLIWGDIASGEDGPRSIPLPPWYSDLPYDVAFKQNETYCKNIKHGSRSARLPNRDEIFRLCSSMSKGCTDFYENEKEPQEFDSSKAPLPNFLLITNILSSTMRPGTIEMPYIGHYTFATDMGQLTNSENMANVRCVLDPQD